MGRNDGKSLPLASNTAHVSHGDDLDLFLANQADNLLLLWRNDCEGSAGRIRVHGPPLP